MENCIKNLYQTNLSTPLGAMTAIADNGALLVLAFTDQPNSTQRISKLITQLNAAVIHSENAVLTLLKTELQDYFSGALTAFSVPVAPIGTPFQQATWKTLQTIPHGTTSHYGAQAKSLLQPTAFRACARANGCNWIAVVIPCHRVIKKNGNLCGYNGGLWRKEWLLKHEGINTLATVHLKKRAISF